MGTPNVNRAKLIADLTAILSQPIYRQLLDRGNEYAETQQHNAQLRAFVKNRSLKPSVYRNKGPAEFAEEAIEAAFGESQKPNLLDPILVVELIPRGQPIRLYRAYDGVSHKTALTLGRWWCNRRLVKQICHSTEQFSGTDREQKILAYLRSAMFVHPERNYTREVARMEIPEGGRLPTIVGKGSWEALKPDPKKKESLEIHTEDDVIEKLAMLPIPGPKQFFTPLFNDMWVRQIPKESANWPLE
jgi:hypothetical protein